MSKKKIFMNRAAHLVDIENQIGSPRCSPHEIEQWFDYYSQTVNLGRFDIVIFGVTNIHNAFSVKASGVPARIIPKFGPDGADLALQDVMEHENLPGRFARVYCASGDGGFADHVSRLAASVPVLVVARKSALSKRLEIAATSVVVLAEVTRNEEAAAALRLAS
ncbi:hypothetical protein [Paenarthrobacter sp. NPDC090522]|uniref:hypothetical protein n=1 Tax=Paenarthrobacter sp. NPDC090522 TaxID=3364383 RepID=UPI0037FDFA55